MTTHFLYFLSNLFSGVLEDAFTILNQSTDVEQLVNINFLYYSPSLLYFHSFTPLQYVHNNTFFFEKYDVLLQGCPCLSYRC